MGRKTIGWTVRVGEQAHMEVVEMNTRLFRLLPGMAAALTLVIGFGVGSPAWAGGSNLMIDTDMHRPVVYLFNTETDQMITVDLTKDPMWPGGDPLHTILTRDGRKAYLSVMSSETAPLTILTLNIGKVDWDRRKADVDIVKVIRVDEPGSQPSMLIPEQTDPRQPVTPLWKPTNHQLHGPTMQPNGKFVYFTQWTDNKIRVIDTSTDALAASDPVRHGTFTRQLHGVYLNPSGTKAIGPGYYYDINYVTVYTVDKPSGALKLHQVIPLTGSEANKEYAAFTHYAVWLDNRYAMTAAQQLGPTSLTPKGFKIIGPSVWLLDTARGQAQMVIGPGKSPNDTMGIYKPASGIIVIGHKLYIGEEDSMDEEVNANEGYVSVWDITDRTAPKFLKRLKPGNELPQGFQLAHEFHSTPDGKYLYVQDWSASYLVKIETATDKVVKVYGKDVGFQMPHGGFIAGNLK